MLQGLTVFFLKSPGGTTSTSYARANLPTVASYTPNPTYSFNPSGGAITATRMSPGVYVMEWTGAGAFGIDGGHPQVTAYGGTNQYCHVIGSGPLNVFVSVRCFDSAGNPEQQRDYADGTDKYGRQRSRSHLVLRSAT